MFKALCLSLLLASALFSPEIKAAGPIKLFAFIDETYIAPGTQFDWLAQTTLGSLLEQDLTGIGSDVTFMFDIADTQRHKQFTRDLYNGVPVYLGAEGDFMFYYPPLDLKHYTIDHYELHDQGLIFQNHYLTTLEGWGTSIPEPSAILLLASLLTVGAFKRSR